MLYEVITARHGAVGTARPVRQFPFATGDRRLGEQLLPAILSSRITSYNVCYTKLLRLHNDTRVIADQFADA